MNSVQRQLVICSGEQWLAGRFDGIEPWGDGLRLNHAVHNSGWYCLPAVDSGENGFEWGRVLIEAQLPADSALRVYARVSDEKGWGDWADIDKGMLVPGEETFGALRLMFGAPAAKSGDFYVKRSGRYLWLMLELAATGDLDPVIDVLRVGMGGDHAVDYLPEIYRKDDFTYRFLSIFNSLLLDMEWEIDSMPQRMDFENTDDEMLEYLASWVCIDGATENLRERIAGILPEYESQYTVSGIKNAVKRLTGKDAHIIEHFTVSPNRESCRNPELYRRLYGDNPYRFFVLLEEGTFQSRQALERFRHRMEHLIPAGTSMELVLLKQSVQLDWHTYLNVNSRLGGYVAATIDENMTIQYDTTIGGANYEA